MKPVNKYKFQFELEEGDIIHISGKPYEYLGNGAVGGNIAVCSCPEEAGCSYCSPREKIVPIKEEVKKNCKCIQPCGCVEIKTADNLESLKKLIKALEKDSNNSEESSKHKWPSNLPPPKYWPLTHWPEAGIIS